MDISEIGLVVSVLSVSVAVIKQSFEIKKSNGNGNGCYVKRDECHNAMDEIGKRITDSRDSLHRRVDDVFREVQIIANLLKNGNGK